MKATRRAASAVTRRTLLLTLLFVFISLALAGWSVISFLRQEGHFLRRELADAAAARERQAKQRRADHLQQQLEKAGVTFAVVKGPFDDLNMTDCEEPGLLLDEVKEFAALKSDYSLYSISLSLGPTFTDAYIDDLADIPKLKTLDVSLASFSDEGLRRLGNAVPDHVTIHDRFAAEQLPEAALAKPRRTRNN